MLFKQTSCVPASMPNVVKPLSLNSLIAFNRALQQLNRLTKLAEGTPSTPLATDNYVFGNQLSLLPDSFTSLCYGPFRGLDVLCDAISERVPNLPFTLLSNRKKEEHFKISSGKEEGIQPLLRALFTQGVPTIYVQKEDLATIDKRVFIPLEVVPVASASEVPRDGWLFAPSISSIHADEIPDSVHLFGIWNVSHLDDVQTPSQVAQLAMNNGILKVNLDDALPASPHSDFCGTPVGFDVIGDHGVYEQALYASGYHGPIMKPVCQFVATAAFEGTLIDCGTITSSNQELAHRWAQHIEEKTGVYFEHHALLSGGCSGELASVASLTQGTTFILPPFFSPQKGILETSCGKVEVPPSFSDLITRLSSAKPGDQATITIPSNPEGHIPDNESIDQLCVLAREKECRIVVDFTYYNVVKPQAKAKFEYAVQTIKESGNYLFLTSGSKSLGLTKYRVALAHGDARSVSLLEEEHARRFSRLDMFAAKALEVALTPEIYQEIESRLMSNILLNDYVLENIVKGDPVHAEDAKAHVMSVLGNSVPDYVQKLDASYSPSKEILALQAVVSDLKQAGLSLDYAPGDGSLYSTLKVSSDDVDDQQRVVNAITRNRLVLTPLALFSGEDVNPVNVISEPQKGFRVALMAVPFVPA